MGARVRRAERTSIPIDAPASRGSAQSGFCKVAFSGSASGWLCTRDLAETYRFNDMQLVRFGGADETYSNVMHKLFVDSNHRAARSVMEGDCSALSRRAIL